MASYSPLMDAKSSLKILVTVLGFFNFSSVTCIVSVSSDFFCSGLCITCEKTFSKDQ